MKSLLTSFFISLLLMLIIHKQSVKSIYIYCDNGVSYESLTHTLQSLEQLFGNTHNIKTINSDDVIMGKWVKDAVLFIMPGGADIPYSQKLNGVGNEVIKNFVLNGGSYLGICAGGYYGSSYVEFDKGGPLEVLGKRELSFFPGKAIGPIISAYNYKSNSGARASIISLDPKEQLEKINLFFNGGAYFEDSDKYENISIIGRYKELDGRAAIIHIKFADGNVILSGVHFEYDPYLLDESDEFLRDIIPKLKYDNNNRKILYQKIMLLLGVKV